MIAEAGQAVVQRIQAGTIVGFPEVVLLLVEARHQAQDPPEAHPGQEAEANHGGQPQQRCPAHLRVGLPGDQQRRTDPESRGRTEPAHQAGADQARDVDRGCSHVVWTVHQAFATSAAATLLYACTGILAPVPTYWGRRQAANQASQVRGPCRGDLTGGRAAG